MGQDGLEEDAKGFGFGFGNWRLKRKVRRLIRAVNILEERLSTNEVSTMKVVCRGINGVSIGNILKLGLDYYTLP